MRKKGLLMLLSLFSLICIFTGCKDEDSVEIVQEGEFVGVYKGALDVKLGEEEVAKNMPQKVYITQVTDAQNQIKMELKNFNFGPLSLGNIAVDKCDVIKKGNTCTFTGKQKLTLPAPIGECDVKLEGSIINDKIELDIDVAATQGGSSIEVEVDFNGSKLAADQSSDAKIESFTFESKFVTSQPVIEGKNITFLVIDSIPAAELAALVPSFTISAKATVSPASGVAQDFSKPVTYKVTSEDGIITTEYTVSVAGKSTLYAFEDWAVGGMYPDIPICLGWANCNDAVALIKNMGPLAGIVYKGGYPVNYTEKKRNGKYAAELISVDTKGGNLFGQKVPKVTAGSMFLGTFNAFAALNNPMSTTSFGIMYNKKPLEVKGYFKYTPGTDFYNSEGVLQPEMKDECSMSAVLYEVENEEETLDGSNIYNSNKIVAQVMFNSADATKEFMPFSLKLTYDGEKQKKYDPTKLYKFAVIFSASKDGAAYNAAVGSTLVIDDVEVITE